MTAVKSVLKKKICSTQNEEKSEDLKCLFYSHLQEKAIRWSDKTAASELSIQLMTHTQPLTWIFFQSFISLASYRERRGQRRSTGDRLCLIFVSIYTSDASVTNTPPSLVSQLLPSPFSRVPVFLPLSCHAFPRAGEL